ncbi:MAG TPA: S24 family peptidase [Pseudomonas sp.]|uniref:S24 family peptidase n=1 Tax=Pseudomonas sp. TaxID=306 RepID=UPI002C23C67B|nr:S24 family peptidase [Pseudomonas sp.]HWH86181.1 S24 family peptidase [Pseudomonas sp.]
MDIYEIRRANLRALVKKKFNGRMAGLAEAVDRAHSYISRCLTDNEKHRKNIGEEFARDLENRLGLLPLALDKPEGEGLASSGERPALDRSAEVNLPSSQGQNLAMDRTISPPAETGHIYSVPLISLSKAIEWVSGGYKMSNIAIEAFIPCPISVGVRAFAIRMPNDSMAGPRAERPIHRDWIAVIDPDSVASPGQIVLASVKGQDPIMGALTPHGGRTYVKPANPEYEKEEIDLDDPNSILGRTVFVGFAM